MGISDFAILGYLRTTNTATGSKLINMVAIAPILLSATASRHWESNFVEQPSTGSEGLSFRITEATVYPTHSLGWTLHRITVYKRRAARSICVSLELRDVFSCYGSLWTTMLSTKISSLRADLKLYRQTAWFIVEQSSRVNRCPLVDAPFLNIVADVTAILLRWYATIFLENERYRTICNHRNGRREETG